jgi:hypothetical protein
MVGEAMNERIKELAEQTGVPLSMPFDQWYAKFAELIVRECLQVINQPNGVGDDDVIRISNDVKKHFGVEE